MAEYDVGTGETYTTIQAWEDAITGVLTEAEIANCKGEAFSENVDIEGSTTTASYYIEVRGKSGARHDGRSHDVSGAGNARLSPSSTTGNTFEIHDEHVRLAWMELKSITDVDDPEVRIYGVDSGGDQRVHHNVIHGDDLGAGGGSGAHEGIMIQDADSVPYVYRNVVYGFLGDGIDNYTGTNSYVVNNTVYACAPGVRNAYLQDGTFKNNSAFDNAGYDFEWSSTPTTHAENISSDTTGDSPHTSKSSGDQFVNATETWANTDLRLKSGADCIDIGENLGSPYDVDIEGDSVTGTWDSGADEYPGGAPPSVTRLDLERGTFRGVASGIGVGVG